MKGGRKLTRILIIFTVSGGKNRDINKQRKEISCVSFKNIKYSKSHKNCFRNRSQ